MVNLPDHSLAQRALDWACSAQPLGVPDESSCPTRDIFRARVDSLMIRLRRNGVPDDKISLTDAVISEIGNNAFDHNLGNWRDMPGVFFGNDISEQRIFAIADRGQGIRTTLSRVRPDITSDAEALRIAFTERISGRAPERRGNGLKFVRHVLLYDGLDLWFYSGSALYTVQKNEEVWNQTDHPVLGCCAIIQSS